MKQLNQIKMNEMVRRTESNRTVLSDLAKALGVKPDTVKSLVKKGMLYCLRTNV